MTTTCGHPSCHRPDCVRTRRPQARYTDGMPVVHGPFGGDDLTPGEIAALRRGRERRAEQRAAYRALPWWRRAWLRATGRAPGHRVTAASS